MAQASWSPDTSPSHSRQWRGFRGGPFAELAIIGQPDVAAGKLENPIVVPGVLSFLCVRFVRQNCPRAERLPEVRLAGKRRLPVLQLPHHGGARDALHAAMASRALLLVCGRLAESTRPMLWVLMLAFPFPYIA